jgi:hypothetical protein
VLNKLEPTDISVKISVDGLTETWEVVLIRGGDERNCVWSNVWEVPVEATGRWIHVVFQGTVDDVMCTAHPRSDDRAVDVSRYKAMVAVVKVDIIRPDENEIHLVGEEIKYDGKVVPDGLEGITYRWSVLEGVCEPVMATTEDFQTILKTKGIIKVKLTVIVGSTVCTKDRTIKTVLPEVIKLSWRNDHLLLEGSSGNSPITDPVWEKPLGGSVTKDKPVAYTKSSSARAELVIIAPDELTHPTSVQVGGVGNKENFYAAGAIFHRWVWDPGELIVISSPLYDSVNIYDKLIVKWRYRVKKLDGGRGEWVEMNTSSHLLYITLAKPKLPEINPHVEIIDYACRWARNEMTTESVCSAIINNGFNKHYTWVGNCHRLSSDFIRLISSLGISGQQHRWKSKYFYPYGSPHIGAMVEQRTISFTPVGNNSAGVIEWWWHQWAEAGGKQRDPSAALSYSGRWGDYEDYLFIHYRECIGTNTTPYQTRWVKNQPGQSVGCEVYPTNCEYLSGTLTKWLGPDR